MKMAKQTNTKEPNAMDAALQKGYVEVKGTQLRVTKKGLRAVRTWKHRNPALSFAFVVRVKEVISEDSEE